MTLALASPAPLTRARQRRVGRVQRTNSEWLYDLRSVGRSRREAAVKELAEYLRAGLAKSFAGQTGVYESDLDDFTQDAILRILTALDSYRGDSRFTTWAMSVGLRTAYTTLRKRRSAHVSLADIEDVVDLSEFISQPRPVGADRGGERNYLLAALRRAIDEQLTRRQRTAILAELRGVSSERLAELLGTNRNALYKLYHDARKKLRRALNEAGFSDADVRLWLIENAG